MVSVFQQIVSLSYGNKDNALNIIIFKSIFTRISQKLKSIFVLNFISKCFLSQSKKSSGYFTYVLIFTRINSLCIAF